MVNGQYKIVSIIKKIYKFAVFIRVSFFISNNRTVSKPSLRVSKLKIQKKYRVCNLDRRKSRTIR